MMFDLRFLPILTRLNGDFPALSYPPPRFNDRSSMSSQWTGNYDVGLNYSYDPYDVSAITLYNGASILWPPSGSPRFRSCWYFHPEASAAGDRWEFIPNSQNYVHKVLSGYEAGGGVPP